MDVFYNLIAMEKRMQNGEIGPEAVYFILRAVRFIHLALFLLTLPGAFFAVPAICA